MKPITDDQGNDGSIESARGREKEQKKQREDIWRDWVEGLCPGSIARKNNLPVKVVYQRLKEMQKEQIVEQGGGD